MLDTANRSCVSRPCKNLPHIYSMITVQNRVVVSHTVYPHEGGPRKFNVGDARAHASDGGVAVAMETRYSHMYYHSKFRRSIGHTVCHIGPYLLFCGKFSSSL